MDLSHLNYFMAAAEYRSFTAAAKATFTTQSNISKNIAQLEAELEVPLFVRCRNGVELTAAGTYLYQELSSLLPQLEDIFSHLPKHADTDSQVLHIGVGESIDINRISPNLLRDFQSQYNIQLHIDALPREKLVELLLDNKLDVVFSYSFYATNHPELLRVPMTRKNCMLYYAQTHPLAQKADLCIEDFKDETFFLRSRKELRDQTFDPFAVLPFVPSRVVEVSSMESVLLNIESGVGVAVLGQSHTFMNKETLFQIEIPTPPEYQVGVDIIWRDKEETAPRSAFLNYLFENYVIPNC